MTQLLRCIFAVGRLSRNVIEWICTFPWSYVFTASSGALTVGHAFGLRIPFLFIRSHFWSIFLSLQRTNERCFCQVLDPFLAMQPCRLAWMIRGTLGQIAG